LTRRLRGALDDAVHRAPSDLEQLSDLDDLEVLQASFHNGTLDLFPSQVLASLIEALQVPVQSSMNFVGSEQKISHLKTWRFQRLFGCGTWVEFRFNA